MLRLFDRPTREVFLPRSPLTIGALIAHVVAVAILLSPLRQIIGTPLLDRELVYLAPPDRVETPGRDQGKLVTQAPSAVADSSQTAPSSRPGTPPKHAGSIMDRIGTAIVAKTAPLPGRELALTELEVDSTVVRDPASAAPVYPAALLNRGIMGLAEVRFVVDTLGTVDTLSVHLVTSTHDEFADAVRRALPLMRFRPAIQHGHPVRQWVEQTFNFRIASNVTAHSSPDR